MFTTPNTINVLPEYEVETDVPSVAEFVTCSLDGRLWVWKRSRRYYVSALRWDEDKQRLVFAGTTILNNINIIGRGIDWILTDTMIIQPSDDEPYVLTANLFDSSSNSSAYSIKRSAVIPLQTVNKQYSLLPAVGDWNIIGDFIVRKSDNPSAMAYNSMLNLRPLIPLEFNGAHPYCATVDNIRITQHDGVLWAKGRYHIGRAFILPAVFAENGSPQEFYLYISPDFIVSPYKSSSSAVTISDWDNLNILHTGEHIYGFLTELHSSLDDGLCYSSDTPKFFAPEANEWLQPAENGAMFIDTFNNSGLILNDDKATFLNGDNTSYECKGIHQWLAPAGKAEAISGQSVISSWDNATLATYVQQGFRRELLAGKKIPLSVKAFEDKRLSIGVSEANSRKVLQVNNIAGLNNSVNAIAWRNVYKQIDVESTSSIGLRTSYELGIGWMQFADLPDCGLEKMHSSSLAFPTSLSFRRHSFAPMWVLLENYTYLYAKPVENAQVEWSTNYYYNYILLRYSHIININVTIAYINPENGEISTFQATRQIPNKIVYTGAAYSEDAISSESQLFDLPDYYVNGKSIYMQLLNKAHDAGGYIDEEFMDFKLCDIPQELLPYVMFPNSINTQNFNATQNLNSLSQLHLSNINSYSVQDNSSNNTSFYANFTETFSNTTIALKCDSLMERYRRQFDKWLLDYSRICDFPNYDSYDEQTMHCRKSFHVQLQAWRPPGAEKSICDFIVFRSELHPEIFDFYSEVERSKLS